MSLDQLYDEAPDVFINISKLWKKQRNARIAEKEIHIEAQKCKHCGEWLDEENTTVNESLFNKGIECGNVEVVEAEKPFVEKESQGQVRRPERVNQGWQRKAAYLYIKLLITIDYDYQKRKFR